MHADLARGSDYNVLEKTAYKVQVSTFRVDYKVQVFFKLSTVAL